MRGLAVIMVPLALAHAGPAVAQADAAQGGQDSFSGFYAGPEYGLVEHHFYIRETNPAAGASRGRYYRSWSSGGGLFAGYDIPIGNRLVVGAEASAVFGGDAPEARFPDGSSYVADPRYGYKFGVRLGRRVGDRTLLFGSAGYGGHHYRVRAVGVGNSKPSGHSFTVGAGIEHRLSPKIGIRLDFKHLDNQMSQLLVGVPVRF
jgi:outer membrane immunogenic protein